MNIYQQELMDHYHHPRNYGELQHADFTSSVFNPSCGDIVAYRGTFKQGRIDTIGFTGKGCVISQAMASMLSERVKGLGLQDVMTLDKDTVLAMVGTELGPTRARCALLPLEALQQSMAEYVALKSQ